MLFSVEREQTWYPLRRELSHSQMPAKHTTAHSLTFPTSKTILRFAYTLSETSAEFGQTERPASMVFLQPRLKSINHLSTIWIDKTESN